VFIVTGTAGGELGHVQAANLDGPRCIQPRKYGGCLLVDDIAQNLRPTGASSSRPVEEVFVGERYAMQSA